MFGWFKPTCPCDPAAKRWVEERLQWLSKQFGLHILLERPVVLPTPEFFPDNYDQSLPTVRQLFRRVCQYMEVDPDLVDVELVNDQTPRWMHEMDPLLGFAAGTWEMGERSWYEAPKKDSKDDESAGGGERPKRRFGKSRIRIERGSLDRPSDLVGTMAHELAHQRLLGEGRARASAFDNELLTDLTAVFYGFGIFLANNPRKSTGKLSYWPGTTLRRPEYLSEPMLGYALAHVAWFRDETWPAWATHLRWTPRSVFKEGLRFLQKTGDSSFPPVWLRALQEEDE
jgi:hypothetical protein